MGTTAICNKRKEKPLKEKNLDYKQFYKSLNDYLKVGRPKNILKVKENEEGKFFDNQETKKNDINNDSLVFQVNPSKQKNNNEKIISNLSDKDFIPSNLGKILDKDKLLNISLEIILSNQQNKKNNITNTNLYNSITFPGIFKEKTSDESDNLDQNFEESVKTNFKIIYNKIMQEIINNMLFPDEYKLNQKNNLNFSNNTISFRELPIHTGNLNITNTNFKNPVNLMDNTNNFIFNTQPNEDVGRKKTSNFNNFNNKIKQNYIETDINNRERKSINSNPINYQRNSIASKTLKNLYDSVFTIKSKSSQKIFSGKNSLKSYLNINNSRTKSQKDNIYKYNLYTIQDYNIDNTSYESKKSGNRNLYTIQNNLSNINRFDKTKNQLARKLYYSLGVRSKILEEKDKRSEYMSRSLSDLIKEYEHIQEEINPIFNIKNCIENKNNNYLDTNEKTEKNYKKIKKNLHFEIDMKQLIRETLTKKTEERIKEKSNQKYKLKVNNLNIKNININIQTQETNSNKRGINKYLNTNDLINGSSEFINSIENFTNINNYCDKKNNPKNSNSIIIKTKNLNSLKNNIENNYSNRNKNFTQSLKKISNKNLNSQKNKIEKKNNFIEFLNKITNKNYKDTKSDSKKFLYSKQKFSIKNNYYPEKIKNKNSGNENLIKIKNSIIINEENMLSNNLIEKSFNSNTKGNNNTGNFETPFITNQDKTSSNLSIDKNLAKQNNFNNNEIISNQTSLNFKKNKLHNETSSSNIKSFIDSQIDSSFNSKDLPSLKDNNSNNNYEKNIKDTESVKNINRDKSISSNKKNEFIDSKNFYEIGENNLANENHNLDKNTNFKDIDKSEDSSNKIKLNSQIQNFHIISNIFFLL